MNLDGIKALSGEKLDKALNGLAALMVAKYGMETVQLLNIPKVTLALLAEYEREIMEIVESDGEIIIEYIDVFVVESVDGVFKRFRGPYNRDTAIAKAREYAELNMNPAVRYYVARWPYKNGYAAPELITATEKVMN